MLPAVADLAVTSAARDALLVAGGLGGGFVNGVAGGGTLLAFPALLASGVPALRANVTTTVGIWPGYLGGVAGFRREVSAQRARVRALAPATVAGGAAGAALLLTTPSDAFRALAPYLILLACGLFGTQPLLVRGLRRREERKRRAVAGARAGSPDGTAGPVAPRRDGLDTRVGSTLVLQAGTFVASVYGAYFGAGLGVVLLGILGLTLNGTLLEHNGLRSVLSLGVNTLAALIFMAAAHVAWADAGILAATSLAGGYAGARLARAVPAWTLRTVVVLLGLAAAARLLAG